MKGSFMNILNNKKGFWQSQMIMGLLTAGFGAAILVFPNLLETLVAGLFLMIGIFLMLSSLTVRKIEKNFQKAKPNIFDV